MGGLVSGALGNQSQPTQPNVQVYQPGSTGSIDSLLANTLTANDSYLLGTNGSTNPYVQMAPEYASLFQSLYNAPTASGYQSAANAAGAAAPTVGNAGVGAATNITSASNSLLPYIQSVLQTGFDPQSALYNQDLQKTTDAANVTNAQYGLTGQQAAGNTTQDISNFNIDWQAQQLGNQLNALAGGTGALTGAASAANTAQSVGTSGLSNILAGGATPYNAAGTIGQNQSSALAAYIQSLLGPTSSTQTTIQDLQDYLNTGVSASAAGASAANSDYYAQLQNEANLGSGLGSLLNLGVDAFSAGGPFAASAASTA